MKNFRSILKADSRSHYPVVLRYNLSTLKRGGQSRFGNKTLIFVKLAFYFAGQMQEFMMVSDYSHSSFVSYADPISQFTNILSVSVQILVKFYRCVKF